MVLTYWLIAKDWICAYCYSLNSCQEINSVTDANPAQWSSTSKTQKNPSLMYLNVSPQLDGIQTWSDMIRHVKLHHLWHFIASCHMFEADRRCSPWFGPSGSSYRASMSSSLSLCRDINGGYGDLSTILAHNHCTHPKSNSTTKITYSCNSPVRSAFGFCSTQVDVDAQLPWHVVHLRQPRVPPFCNCRLAFLVSLQGLR